MLARRHGAHRRHRAASRICAAACLLVACDAQTTGVAPKPWGPRADEAVAGLLDTFWFDEAHVFYSTSRGMLTLNYWWQAHALDVLADNAERHADGRHDARMAELWAGVVALNGGETNGYYDDMEWMQLALLRAHGLTGNEGFRDDAGILWDDIRAGWSDVQGGGISWNKTELDYKNAPANLPAAIFAYRLHRLEGDPADLAFGHQIMDWLEPRLVDPDTGLIWDGIRMGEGGPTTEKNLYTYNQGTYVGACLAAYETTGDAAWLTRAVRTADAGMGAFLRDDDSGVMRDEGAGDGGLFRGIFVRYLADLAREPGLAAVDEGAAGRIRSFLTRNAEALWQDGRSDAPPTLFGIDWSTPPGNEVVLSVDLTAVMLLEAMARLEADDP